MASSVCPLWIDPGNAFRLLVKVAKYVAEADRYGLIEILEQEHELWLDTNYEYSIARFHEELATKMFWGPSQTISAWVLDQDTRSEWKIRRDEHFQQMIKDRWDQRCAVILVDVVRKDASSGPCQKKREAGRLRKNRIKSARETGGKATRQAMCPNCKEYGHRTGSWKCPHTGTKKRKRTKKTTAKVGRKKAKAAATTAEATTPRTRATLKKEAVEKARKEAEEAELRAAEAREAAKRAAREEAQATNEVIEAMALQVRHPDPPTEPTTARRSLFAQDQQDALQVQVHPTKMTPRRKVLATKVKKTPEKRAGRKKK